MSTCSVNYRYCLPKKAIKGDCPQCGPKYRRTLSRYIDSQTGDVLPEQYGRCDREDNCGYLCNPYHKDAAGTSYAERVFDIRNGRANRSLLSEQWVTAAPLTVPIYSIPDELFRRTLGYYDRNQFARLLREHFGPVTAADLLHRFQIGTSAYWPGATVFWLIDMQGKARGGQVNLFADDWHRAKWSDRISNTKPCISSVSYGLLRRYKNKGEDIPAWLTDYHDNAPRWPVPFGLHQLRTAPVEKPVAIVEACKTAVVCAGYFPEFIWLAIGAKSYPNTERFADLRGRRIVLFPDINAYADWSKRAESLRTDGFHVNVSSLLEDRDTDEQRKRGLDLADFLLQLEEPKAVQPLAE